MTASDRRGHIHYRRGEKQVNKYEGQALSFISEDPTKNDYVDVQTPRQLAQERAKEYRDNAPNHPGRLIKLLLVEDLAGAIKGSLNALAEKLKISHRQATDLVACRIPLKSKVALQLEKHTVFSAERWMAMQNRFDIDNHRRKGN